jgi:hypothetical protein
VKKQKEKEKQKASLVVPCVLREGYAKTQKSESEISALESRGCGVRVCRARRKEEIWVCHSYHMRV